MSNFDDIHKDSYRTQQDRLKAVLQSRFDAHLGQAVTKRIAREAE
jgi:hypothetical protein